MSADFAALVGSIAVGVPGVRSCLLVTTDGLALAATPPADEERILGIWSNVAELGDVQRGFLVNGSETWVFCQAESYGALAVADTNVRPGILLDRLQQLVAVAEDYRARHEVLAGQGGGLAALGQETARAGAPRRFKLPLHREEAPPAAAGLEEAMAAPPARRERRQVAEAPAAPPPPESMQPTRSVPPPEPPPPPEAPEPPEPPAPEPASPKPADVDVSALTREFSGLLVEGE